MQSNALFVIVELVVKDVLCSTELLQYKSATQEKLNSSNVVCFINKNLLLY